MKKKISHSMFPKSLPDDLSEFDPILRLDHCEDMLDMVPTLSRQ